jgi:hypothetical protein
LALDVINIQYSGEQDVVEGDPLEDMFTFCDSDPKKGVVFVDVVKFWPTYWAPHCMLENFKEALGKPKVDWAAASQPKAKTSEILEWLKQPNFFAEDFKMMDKHFKSNKDLFVAGRWAVVLNVVGQRYFAGPMSAFAAFPRKSILKPEEQPEEKEPEESPTGKRTKSQQLGAASGGAGLALMEEEEVVVPKKKKRKAKVVKEFVVTWDTKLETSHMSESHVTQAFGLMQTRSITTPDGIVVSAKSCIEPALGRLARAIDKEHVAELMRLYKKEQKQGELWLVRKQIRLICFFVMTCMCS